MNFRSIGDLDKAIIKSLATVPMGMEAVVGIPRSGMLPATMLALYLHLPLADLRSLKDGRILLSGRRREIEVGSGFFLKARKVLVVDDSVNSGRTIDRVRDDLAALPHECRVGCVYLAPGAESHVDFFFEHVPQPRCFAWNVLNTIWAEDACVDIDGVLCRDPTREENDDGERYRDFLRTAEPHFRSRYEIGWVVTSRLEKYRPDTEAWLQAHGIRFRSLLMMNAPNMQTRRAQRLHGVHKGEVYRSVPARLFVESSLWQATEIANISGKPVIAINDGEVILPDSAHSVTSQIPSRSLRDAIRAVLARTRRRQNPSRNRG